MTDAFVKSIISSDYVNKWVSLAGTAQRIGLIKDSHIAIDPRLTLMYFDDSNKLLYLRNMTGVLKKIDPSNYGSDGSLKSSVDIPDGYNAIQGADGNWYLDQTAIGGIEIDGVGIVHDVIDYDAIAAFYFPDRNIDMFVDAIADGE